MTGIGELKTREIPNATRQVGESLSYDVFISYSHKDKDWVFDQLLPRLEKADMKVGIDQNWRAGEPFSENIERAIRESPHTIVVLTDNWLTSEWCRLERRLVSLLDPAACERRLIPLLLSDCRGSLPDSIASLIYRDFTGDSDHDQEWRRLLKDLGADDKKTGEAASRGFKALTKLMRSNADVHAAVIKSQAALSGVSEKIKLLTAYKALHDCFHQIEGPLALLAKDAQNLSADAHTWEDIQRDEALSFREILSELIKVAGQSALADEEAIWLTTFEFDSKRLRESIDDQDAESCKEVIDGLEDVLNREPSRINTKLLAKAKELRLDSLVDELSRIEHELATFGLSGNEAEECESFRNSIRILAEYESKLRKYVDCHNILQHICDELNAKDPFRFRDIRQFETAWLYQEKMLEQLKGVCEFACLASVWEQAGTLKDELHATRNLHKIRRQYLNYQAIATHVFNKVNVQLKRFCNSELKALGESLTKLMGRMQHE